MTMIADQDAEGEVRRGGESEPVLGEGGTGGVGIREQGLGGATGAGVQGRVVGERLERRAQRRAERREQPSRSRDVLVRIRKLHILPLLATIIVEFRVEATKGWILLPTPATKDGRRWISRRRRAVP